MQILNEIEIQHPSNGKALIQLLQGDLSAIPKEHAADILVISAYPGSYIPVPNTLIAALDKKGLIVKDLAAHKSADLRDQLGCWLSEPLNKEQQAQFNFKKILCFEPWHQPAEKIAVVGNIFRCINTFAFSDSNNVIAMPVLASGQQKVSYEKMLPALLDNSIFWLENGLPLTCIKLVLHSDAQAAIALPIFNRAKQQNEVKQSLRNGVISKKTALEQLAQGKKDSMPGEEEMQIVQTEIRELTSPSVPVANSPMLQQGSSGRNPTPAVDGLAAVSQPTTRTIPENNSAYDFFISYAHKHAGVIDSFVNDMTSANPSLKIFYDKSSIPPGGLWLKQISDAIQQSKKILIFLSPDYSNSPVCWDEFQCAKLMEYNSKKPLIQTIYLYNDVAMPPIMGIYSWSDGREGDQQKLKTIITQLLSVEGVAS